MSPPVPDKKRVNADAAQADVSPCEHARPGGLCGNRFEPADVAFRRSSGPNRFHTVRSADRRTSAHGHLALTPPNTLSYNERGAKSGPGARPLNSPQVEGQSHERGHACHVRTSRRG
jgi:hypothetical protein